MELKQGDLENIIINALWDLESEGAENIYVGDIQKRIQSSGRSWAYTTVKTVLDRLVDKSVAVRHKQGKKYFYRSVVQRDEAAMGALKKLIRQYFQGDMERLANAMAILREDGYGLHPAMLADEKLRIPDSPAEIRELSLRKYQNLDDNQLVGSVR